MNIEQELYTLRNESECYFDSVRADSIEQAAKKFVGEYTGGGFILGSDMDSRRVKFANNRAYLSKNLYPNFED